MNVFASYSCPIKSAEFLDDKRVVKMILESCQMLNMACQHFGGTSMGYKSTHKNHPCTKWCCKNLENYWWLVQHFEALCNEYAKRYNKVHKCSQYLEHFKSLKPSTDSLESPTSFENCTANHKYMIDVHEAYKACLREKWLNDKRSPTKYQKTFNMWS